MASTAGGPRAAIWVPVVAFVTAVLAAVPMVPGSLVITMHEVDTLHLSDIVLRMADRGQMPYRDFSTPLGILGLWPIALFREAGLGLGHAMLAAQAAVAAVVFLPVIRVALSRFSGWLAVFYAFYTLTLCIALVYGGTVSGQSMSMHYNRWSWALAYIAIPLAMIEPLAGRSRATSTLDGALIGLALAALVLIKITYFVALAPVALLALVLRRDGRALGAMLVCGLAVAALTTALLGFGFWLRYAGEVLAVAHSTTRAAPGDSLSDILTAPKYVAGTAVLLVTIVLLRRAGALTAGLNLLLLMPGFIYITYQNYGNDPQWLLLLGLIALLYAKTLSGQAAGAPDAAGHTTAAPLTDAIMADGHLAGGGVEGGPGRAHPEVGVADPVAVRRLWLAGTVALALAAPSAINLALSPVWAMTADRAVSMALITDHANSDDLRVQANRAETVRRIEPWMGSDSPYASYASHLKMLETRSAAGSANANANTGEEAQAQINGQTLPECELSGGFLAGLDQMAKDLQQAGYAQKQILVTDLVAPLWLYADLAPVEGASPWYYEGTPGVAQADYIAVPLCPGSQQRRRIMLSEIQKAGWHLQEIRRTETYILLKPSRA